MHDNTLFIIDAYGFVFRAYHTQPGLQSASGIPTGALYGFTSMMLKLLNDFKPPSVVLALDSGGRGFRQDLYAEYKTHRPPVPNDLKQQLPLIREAAMALNIPVIEHKDYEADDLIASMAYHHVERCDDQVIIVSSDKDLMQLITPRICLYDPIKSCYIREAEVLAKFGVLPTQVQDWLAMVGDRADNIPGLPGIGPKKATELLSAYGTLDSILANSAQLTNNKVRQVIEQNKDAAVIYQKLVGLKQDIEMNLSCDQLLWQPPVRTKIYEFLSAYNFHSLLSKTERLFNTAPQQSDKSALQISVLSNKVAIEDTFELDKLLADATVVSILADELHLVMAIEREGDQSVIEAPIREDILQVLIRYLVDPAVRKVTYDLKLLLRLLAKHDIEVANIAATDDIMLMYYTINTGNPQPPLSELIGILEEPSSIKLVTKLSSYRDSLYQKLLQNSALSLYHDLDLPLAKLLFAIEQRGLRIDTELLLSLADELGKNARLLEKNIFLIAGQEFNLASPKQLGDILFERLSLPGAKLSKKTQSYTTNFEVLERLSEAGFTIATDILEWRQLVKLKNTYADALPKQVNPVTGRIHTTLLQTSTNTARLSSINPNLQNIPIRSKEGNKIRAAFIPSPGSVLISADYSQIELRVLSHLAGVASFKSAFEQCVDIHAQTACQVFNMSPEELDAEHRRRAKAINFGIIYGISPFGLAKQLGISTYEAKNYIDRYLQAAPEIEIYMDYIKETVKQQGYIENLFGRKCFITGMKDYNATKRGFAERAAINAPIQSTAADIVKIAMLRVEKQLQNFKTSILLQVHDELILEAPEEEIEEVMPLIKKQMEQAVSLDVPLLVEIKAGENWAAIH